MSEVTPWLTQHSKHRLLAPGSSWRPWDHHRQAAGWPMAPLREAGPVAGGEPCFSHASSSRRGSVRPEPPSSVCGGLSISSQGLEFGGPHRVYTLALDPVGRVSRELSWMQLSPAPTSLASEGDRAEGGCSPTP